MPGDKYYTVKCESDKMGFKFNGVEITTVTKGGWAESNGIEIDDEIFEVNGKIFGGQTTEEQLRMLKGVRPLEIKFKRPIVKDSYYSLTVDGEKVGMGFRGATVARIVDGGWASKMGILQNDEIVEVNGKGFSQLSTQEQIAMFGLPRPIVIRLKRPATTIKRIALSGATPTLPSDKGKQKDTNLLPDAFVKMPTDTPVTDTPLTEANVMENAKFSEMDDPIFDKSTVGSGAGFCSCCAVKQ